LLLAGSLWAGSRCFSTLLNRDQQLWGLAMLGAELDFNPSEGELAVSWADAENLHPQGATSTAAGVRFRSAGPIGEPNRYAQVLVVLLPLAALRFRRERSRAFAVARPGVRRFYFGGMVLTFSRGAMFTAVVTSCLLACFRLIRPLHVVVAALAVISLVLVVDPRPRSASQAWRIKTLLAIQLPVITSPPRSDRGTRHVSRSALRPERGGLARFPRLSNSGRGSRTLLRILFDGLLQPRWSHRTIGRNTAGTIFTLRHCRDRDFGLASFLAIILAICTVYGKSGNVAARGFRVLRCGNGFFLCLVAYLISAFSRTCPTKGTFGS